MVSIERIRKLLGDPSMSDEEAAAVRDMARALAEIAFQTWRGKVKSKKNLPKGSFGTSGQIS